jgi:hypothetical protein
MIFERLIVTCALLAATTARAAEPKDEARRILDEGSALYRAGDYQGALTRFERAREIYPSARIYFNMGQALHRLQRRAAAVDAFERFLEEAPDAAAEPRHDAERLLEELRPQIGRVRVAASAGSEIAIDGKTVGTAPLSRAVPLDPGGHDLSARAPGASVAHVGRVEIVAGETATWEAVAAPPPLLDAPPPAPPVATLATEQPSPAPAPAKKKAWWPWLVAGAFVAGTVVILFVPRSQGSLPTGTLGSTDTRR